MTTQIISDVNFNDPTNLIPFLEKDDAILRGVTKAMLDFSNPASYAGGALTVGGTVKSLTNDGSNATAGAILPAQVTGLVDFGNANGATQTHLTLPDTFKLPNTCRRFLLVLWVKLPANGYQTASSNVIQSLIGFMNNSSTLAQWGVLLNTIQASGLPSSLSFLCPFSASSVASISLLGADAAAVCDGNLHQLAGYWDGESVAGQITRSVYVDKVLKATASVAWDGTLNVPASNVRMGYNVAFQVATPTGFKLGRPSMWDLTAQPAWTPAQILQRDWDAAQGFLA